MTTAIRKMKAHSEAKTTESTERSTFSEKIYDFKWTNHFPLQLKSGEQVHLTDFSTAARFIKENHARIFQRDHWGDRFFDEDQLPSKYRYYKEVADCFLFIKDGQTYGVFLGTAIDGTSYYIRYCAILPEFQNGGRFQGLLTNLLQVLSQHGVVRAEGDFSPANLVNIHLFNKLQFNITGITLSERWGALVHMTKILNSKAENIFLNQFCTGTRPQQEGKIAEVIQLNKSQGGSK